MSRWTRFAVAGFCALSLGWDKIGSALAQEADTVGAVAPVEGGDAELGRCAPLSGAIFTTDQCGQRVNGNIYSSCEPVACGSTDTSPFLNGGPPPNAPCTSAGLPDGTYYFQVTDPSGSILLSSDDITDRVVVVLGGVIVAHPGPHVTGPGQCAGSISVALWPFLETPNPGGVYKAWITRVDDYDPSDPQSVFGFVPSCSKTDNFKCLRAGEGACCIDVGGTPTCEILTEQECTARGGVFEGEGTVCGPKTCPGPSSCIGMFKYYDANANGEFDLGVDTPLDGFRIRVRVFDADDNEIFPEPTTPPDIGPDIFISGRDGPGAATACYNTLGRFPYRFVICEILPGTGGSGSWAQTEPNAGSTGAIIVDGQYCWGGTIKTPGQSVFVPFGNVCLGGGGGHTLGFWSNRNGQRVMADCTGGMCGSLADLNALCLRTATGADADFGCSYASFRSWLLSASAENMANMLSAQLAAMTLNVRNAACLGNFGGGVSPGAIIYAPGTTCANPLGYATVGCILGEADAELCAHGFTPSGSPFRDYQEALKNALDDANNNLTFVQGSPCPIVYP